MAGSTSANRRGRANPRLRSDPTVLSTCAGYSSAAKVVSESVTPPPLIRNPPFSSARATLPLRPRNAFCNCTAWTQTGDTASSGIWIVSRDSRSVIVICPGSKRTLSRIGSVGCRWIRGRISARASSSVLAVNPAGSTAGGVGRSRGRGGVGVGAGGSQGGVSPRGTSTTAGSGRVPFGIPPGTLRRRYQMAAAITVPLAVMRDFIVLFMRVLHKKRPVRAAALPA
jgi:hypothetical protein